MAHVVIYILLSPLLGRLSSQILNVSKKSFAERKGIFIHTLPYMEQVTYLHQDQNLSYYL